MSKFQNRKTGQPVTAVQFTDFKSAERMAREMSAYAIYRHTLGTVRLDGTVIKRGQYAVMSMAAIVAMDSDTFNGRFKPYDTQMEMF